MWKSSGALVSGPGTRGSRNIDIDQSTNRSPSVAYSVLNTLGPSPLLTCDCNLGWHLAKTVHVNTLFNLLVCLTLAVSPQHVKCSANHFWETHSSPIQIFMKAIEPSVIFVQNILRQTEIIAGLFLNIFTFKKKRLQDRKQRRIWLQLTFSLYLKYIRDMTENRARRLPFPSNSNTVWWT